jgi:hypothetical protein
VNRLGGSVKINEVINYPGIHPSGGESICRPIAKVDTEAWKCEWNKAPTKAGPEGVSGKESILYLSNLFLAHPCFLKHLDWWKKESIAETTSDGRKSAFLFVCSPSTFELPII